MLETVDEARLALAVSGGSDSMAMLRLALRERDASSLAVLTVDHGLRAGSRAEAEQVGQWCRDLGCAHHILTWPGEKPATGLQAKARKARYDLMAQWCLAQGIRFLFTAHTRDDQAETVAMRKRRTQSLRSLAGIWPVMDWQGVQVMRPLLDRGRADLRALLRDLGQGWIDDPSNENASFERVRVRLGLAAAEIPDLAAEADVARAASVAGRAQAAAWLRARAEISSFGSVRLPREGFQSLDPAVAEDVLTWALMACGGGQRPERGEVERLIAALRGDATVRRTLAGALVAGRQRDIVVGREPGRLDATPVVIGSEGKCRWDGRFVVTGAAGSTVAPAGAAGAGPAMQVLADRLPAFVRQGLPRVLLACGTAVLPHLQPQCGVEVRLSERFAI